MPIRILGQTSDRHPRRGRSAPATVPKVGRKKKMAEGIKGVGKKKKLKTITVGTDLGDSGAKILTLGHKNPEGLKDATKIEAKPHSSKAGRVLSYIRTSPMVLRYNKGGRAGKQSGGRTRLLEELGRVEAEPSNRNRRAEISRVHGELNRGYKVGGKASPDPRMESKVPKIKSEKEKREDPYVELGKAVSGGEKGKPHSTREGQKMAGARYLTRMWWGRGKKKPRRQGRLPAKTAGGRSGYGSGGAVLKGKKVGIQIK